MQNQPTESSANNSKNMLLVIITALALWGGFHAVGTYTAGDVADWRKPIIVLACSLSFLSFWGLLLYLRGRRS